MTNLGTRSTQKDHGGRAVVGSLVGVASVFVVLYAVVPDAPDNWLDAAALAAAVIAGAFLGKAAS